MGKGTSAEAAGGVDEEDAHRLVVLVGDERVALAGRLDERLTLSARR
jgi:hypothetical protein